MCIRDRGNLPPRGLPATPTLTNNVESWLQNNGAAIPPTTTPEAAEPQLSQTQLNLRAALLKSKEREAAQQREIEELRQRIKKDAEAALEAATIAIQQREKEVNEKVTAEANRRYEVEAERHRAAMDKIIQEKTAAIADSEQARTEAAAAQHQLQSAVTNARAEATAEKSQRMRMEEQARQATEAKRVAEEAIAVQRRQMEQQKAAAAAAAATAAENERRQRESRILLPSMTPANPPSSAEKNKKK